MNTISISEIQRNLHKLDDFDIIEVVDKKRRQVKGYFLDKKYSNVVESLYNKKEKKTHEALKEFRDLSKNVSKIDPKIDILTMDKDINSDIF